MVFRSIGKEGANERLTDNLFFFITKNFKPYSFKNLILPFNPTLK
jgi:hypothetical protein